MTGKYIVKFTDESTEVTILEKLATSKLTPRILSKRNVSGGNLLWLEHGGRTPFEYRRAQRSSI